MLVGLAERIHKQAPYQRLFHAKLTKMFLFWHYIFHCYFSWRNPGTNLHIFATDLQKFMLLLTFFLIKKNLNIFLPIRHS